MKNFFEYLKNKRKYPGIYSRNYPTDSGLDYLYRYIIDNESSCQFEINRHHLTVSMTHPVLNKPIKIEFWIANRFYSFGEVEDIYIDTGYIHNYKKKLPSVEVTIEFWEKIVKPRLIEFLENEEEIDKYLRSFKRVY